MKACFISFLLLCCVGAAAQSACAVYFPPDSLFCNLIAYKDWDKVMLIKGKDSVLVKVRPARQEDSRDEWQNIYVVYKGGETRTISKRSFGDMIVYTPDGNYAKYSSFIDDDGYADLYTILVDGKCQLLYASRFLIMDVADPVSGQFRRYHIRVGNYYIYYKNEFERWTMRYLSDETEKLSKYRMPDKEDINKDFVRKTKRLFGDCKPLMKKVETGQCTRYDLETIVREFNMCVK